MPVVVTETEMVVVRGDEVTVTSVGVQGPPGPPGLPGTTDHALLTHLDFASAGHTGFAGTGVSNTFSVKQTIDLNADGRALDILVNSPTGNNNIRFQNDTTANQYVELASFHFNSGGVNHSLFQLICLADSGAGLSLSASTQTLRATWGSLMTVATPASAADSSITLIAATKSGQTGDVFRCSNSVGTPMLQVGPTGATTLTNLSAANNVLVVKGTTSQSGVTVHTPAGSA